MTKILFVDGSNIHQGTRFSMQKYQNEMIKSLSIDDFSSSVFTLTDYKVSVATYMINIISLFFRSLTYDYIVSVDHSDALFSIICNPRKRIIVVHDLIMLDTRRLSRKIYRSLIYKSISTCQNLIFASHTTRTRFSNLYNWDGNELILSPCVEPREHQVRNLELSPIIIRVLFIGNDEEYKNRDHFLQLIQYANSKSLNLHFTLITPELPLCEYLKYQCYSNVDIFSGVSSQKIQQSYIDSDILVVPSIDEGFGWHCIEAISSGCVVLSTKNGALVESVKSDVYISGNDCSETASLIFHVVSNRISYLKLQQDNITQYETPSFQHKLRKFFHGQSK